MNTRSGDIAGLRADTASPRSPTQCLAASLRFCLVRPVPPLAKRAYLARAIKSMEMLLGSARPPPVPP
jgi:hypothetical protein